jgi:hypothetical protein
MRTHFRSHFSDDLPTSADGFATSSFIQPAGYFPEFLPDFASDVSSIANVSEHGAPDFTQKSTLQDGVMSSLDEYTRPIPTRGGVGTCATDVVIVSQHFPRCSSPLQEQKTSTSRERGKLHGNS